MNKNILIIDDHDEMRTAVVYLLENAARDYDVFSCRTADEGLGLLKEYPDIQVIILDIIMPSKDGIQTLDELKDRLENLRVIVLTAYPSKFDADQAKELGVFRYLAKPPEEEPLVFAIEAAFTDIKAKKLEEELQLARQWEEIGVLSAGFIHWVGNKIQLIDPYLELIKGEVLNLSPSAEQDFQQISKVLKDVTDMREILLKPFRKTRIETVDIIDVLEEVFTFLELPSDVVIYKNYRFQSLKICFNKQELKMIFDELFHNALKAMKNAEKKQLNLTICDENEKVVIKITDSGCGIKEETRDKLFRAFYADKGSEGYGVGLFAVKNTLAKFKGTISCTSRIGEGTEFEISLRKEL